MIRLLKFIFPVIKIWRAYRSDFLAIYASEQDTPVSHSALEKWFIDSKGHQYYKFPKQMALPLERTGHLQGYYTFLAAGVSGSEMDEVINTMDQILTEGIGKPETAAKFGALIHVLKERRAMVFHTEILYNILAVQAIREDEMPEIFNQDMQDIKVMQFKAEVEKQNSYFFFQTTRLDTPLDLLRFSQAEWTVFWHESEVMQASLKEILNCIRSEKKSMKKAKISENK